MFEDLSKYLDKAQISDNEFVKKGTRAGKLGVPGSSTDRANRATQDQVLDPRTKMILLKMINKGTFDDLKACISTGKEANVYRAVIEEPAQQLAVKVYKTAILAFKDRERYVVGEYRFRFGYSKSNPRKMVKLWAEKETRNLKRIWKSDIPVPKPLVLDHHVLVMQFLGSPEGYGSPKLKDADIDADMYPYYYYQLLSYMRIMYQECRLVHADLSEYNILYHEEKLWIIDVSQSVEHDHPMSLQFLRMDIKNVNDYFEKKGGVTVFGERQLFEFITRPPSKDAPWPEKSEMLIDRLMEMPREEITDKLLSDNAVFRNVYIPRNLNDVFDVDRDVNKIKEGEQEDLIYKDLLQSRPNAESEVDSNAEATRVSENNDRNDKSQSERTLQVDSSTNADLDSASNAGSDTDLESGSESGSDSDSDSDLSDEELTNVWDEEWDRKVSRNRGPERKFLDRDANKDRKKQVKQEKKEKRATKMKKKDKKRLISASKGDRKSGCGSTKDERIPEPADNEISNDSTLPIEKPSELPSNAQATVPAKPQVEDVSGAAGEQVRHNKESAADATPVLSLQSGAHNDKEPEQKFGEQHLITNEEIERHASIVSSTAAEEFYEAPETQLSS